MRPSINLYIKPGPTTKADRELVAHMSDQKLKQLNELFAGIDRTDTYNIVTNAKGNVVPRHNPSPNQLLLEIAYADILSYCRKTYPTIFPKP